MYMYALPLVKGAPWSHWTYLIKQRRSSRKLRRDHLVQVNAVGDARKDGSSLGIVILCICTCTCMCVTRKGVELELLESGSLCSFFASNFLFVLSFSYSCLFSLSFVSFVREHRASAYCGGREGRYQTKQAHVSLVPLGGGAPSLVRAIHCDWNADRRLYLT